ncbi:MAG: D-alanine--D-alanine ligase [Bacteroidaceae bacterium]
MKRVIAIVAGGDSSEHDVSLRSALGIYSFIDKEKYDCYIIEIKGQSWEAFINKSVKVIVDHGDFSFQTINGRIRPDFAYITIHGTPGEDGILQGYFDMIGLPYSTSNVLVEALTFNKFTLNQYLRSFGIRISESMMIRKGQEKEVHARDIVEKIGLPCFIKPNAGGSSFGVTKVLTINKIEQAISKAFAESNEVMIEAMMSGTEITCGCYKTRTHRCVFPITEVVTDNDFFDYNAKYNGQVQEITPARIAPATAERVQALTSSIYDILGCEGLIRIDYILTKENDEDKINLLEINTTPGMTATSFIPQQIKAAGLDIKDVMTHIIENKF